MRRLRMIQRGLQVGHINSRWTSGSTKGEIISRCTLGSEDGMSLEKGKSRTRRLDGLDPKVGEEDLRPAAGLRGEGAARPWSSQRIGVESVLCPRSSSLLLTHGT